MGHHSLWTEKWGANQEADRDHWTKLNPALAIETDLLDKFEPSRTEYAFPSDQYIYMRWKEHFLVPNHKLTRIEGASFDGFYYIIMDRFTGALEGFYYHISSEKYQKLDLQPVEDNLRSFPSYAFQ